MNVEDIKLIGDRILIIPAELYTYSKTEWVPDKELNDGKNPLVDEVAMKEVTKEVKSFYQKATVVNVGDVVDKVKVGDEIIYNINACAQFELVQGIGVLRQYDIVGLIKK